MTGNSLSWLYHPRSHESQKLLDHWDEQKPDNSNNELEGNLDLAVTGTIIAENKRLKEVLSKERRHHAKEKSRIRQVIFAIDEALSSLPSRLGKIRAQNQKNLMMMNSLPVEFHDRGDFEIVETSSEYMDSSAAQEPQCMELSPVKGIQLSEDVYSDVSNPQKTPLLRKMESLNNLIEDMKNGETAEIEAVLNNELRAISLLKNEIKYTKRKIDRRTSESESVIHASQQNENRELLQSSSSLPEKNPKNKKLISLANECNSDRPPNAEEQHKIEKYIRLQNRTINVLASEVERTKEMVTKEMEEKERIQLEKRALVMELTKMKKFQTTCDEGSRSRGRGGEESSAIRPFRIIRELKSQIEEKEKALANLKARIARLEGTCTNKGVLLENEKKKNEDLEARLKILLAENKSFASQMKTLQYINKELKDQMEVLKNQIEILINQKTESKINNQFDLKNYLTELVSSLKEEDTRVKTVQQEAERKIRQLEQEHQNKIEQLKTSFERSEKTNMEYLRTFKVLLSSLHNYQSDKYLRLRSMGSYDRVKEILCITESELEDLFDGNMKESSQKELDNLYEQCYSLVNDEEDCEFSLKLSTWLFDLVKQKMTDQNFNDNSDQNY